MSFELKVCEKDSRREAQRAPSAMLDAGDPYYAAPEGRAFSFSSTSGQLGLQE